MNSFEKSPSLIQKPKIWLSGVQSTFGENRGIQLLSAVLVVQLVVAGGLLWRSNLQTNFTPTEQLVSVDAAMVTQISISDEDDNVTLTLADDQWRLNDEHDTPASAAKVEQLISDITGLKPGLPVASTRGSHEQLEVAEDSFQRRITLKAADETVVDLLVGTSPGFRKSHVRQISQDQVYAARLNTYDVPTDQDDWLDQNLLAFDGVDGVKADDIELSRAGDQWSIVLPEEQSVTHEVEKQGIDALVSTLISLRVNGFAMPLVADEPSDAETSESSDVETADAEDSESEPLLNHTLSVVQNDEPITLTLSRKGGDATIERSDVKGLYALPVTTYDKLTAEAVKSVVIEKGSEESADEEQPQG